MAKSNAATRKSRTHFEQVSVDVVKKIAERDVPKERKVRSTSASGEPTPRKKG
jgi:hypothetical protein